MTLSVNGAFPGAASALGAPSVPQPGAGSGSSDLNDTLKKMTKAVDKLREMVDQHADHLQDHATAISKIDRFLRNEPTLKDNYIKSIKQDLK